MLVQIPSLLGAEQVADFRARLEGANWVDGRVTAGHQSARTKRNLQLREDDPVARALSEQLLQVIPSNLLFMACAVPFKIFPPLFNCYREGQGFGAHIDNAIRSVPDSPHRVRTDLSMTLFLSDTDEYEGGELIIEDTFGGKKVKLPSGHAVLYPASSVHRVAPVTRGQRIAAFFWIQSMVRDAGRREVLFDLDLAIQQLNDENPDSAAGVRLTGVYHNLLRMWAHV
ncbi:Fe2+-dependent dioxygenase [Elongatibacter sediminis]|uniref:Fe2+-dependent dioxygenase n=1 Tax=Elongatibacter sediminis TaxID=3119006 RepID=A0AAW9R9L9_9GAMM